MTKEEKLELLNRLLEIEEKNDIGNLTRTERGEFQQWIKSLEQEPSEDEIILTKEEYKQLLSSEFDNGYAKGYREALEEKEPILDITREKAEKIVRGITDKIEATTDIDDWAEFWGFTRDEYEEFLDMATKAAEQHSVLDKLRAEIEQNAYPIVHGVNDHELGMTLYGILQVIDKYKAEVREEEPRENAGNREEEDLTR